MLKELLEKNGISLKDLSETSKVSYKTLLQLKSGTANPTFSTLVILAKSLNASVVDLISPELLKDSVKYRIYKKEDEPNPDEACIEEIEKLKSDKLDLQTKSIELHEHAKNLYDQIIGQGKEILELKQLLFKLENK